MEITSRFQNLNWSNLNTTSAVCWDLQEVNISHFFVNRLVRQAGRQSVNWSVSQSVSLCLLVSQSVCLSVFRSKSGFQMASQSNRQAVIQSGRQQVTESACQVVCVLVSQPVGANPNIFLRDHGMDVTDGWRKEILKANNEEEGLWQVNKIMWTADNT